MINYSIIIPHKNIPQLLQRCLDSIPNRDDIEIIVVDDNSDLNIVDRDNFPLKNISHYYVYFFEKSMGAGAARNFGMSKARGKWLLFVDSDDFLSKDVSSIFDNYINSDDDLVYFYTDSVISDTLEPANRHFRYNCKLDKAIKEDDYNIVRYKINEPWGKLVNRSLIIEHNIYFEEVMYSNDVMFSLYVGNVANKISIDNRVLYVVTNRDDSLTDVETFDSVKIRYNVTLRYNSFLYKIGKGKYHVNLFAYVYRFHKIGFANAIIYLYKAFVYTPCRYVIHDIYACFYYMVKGNGMYK